MESIHLSRFVHKFRNLLVLLKTTVILNTTLKFVLNKNYFVTGDSAIDPTSAKLALTTLCPALYAVFSDGLKPCLETSFGAINNSVWQVVEASSQQGPLTKALNDLVMKINSEDVISEGLGEFNLIKLYIYYCKLCLVSQIQRLHLWIAQRAFAGCLDQLLTN